MGQKMISKLFKLHQRGQYPLMRDPTRQPKCYEMTDQERLEASRRVEELLKQRSSFYINEAGLRINATTGDLMQD
jgi:hypothetical protein